MIYQCTQKYESANKAKIGVLITNLGTPDLPEKKSLKIYLKEFLSDTRVVEPPPARFIWKAILNLIILNTRPKKSAEAYKSVWGKFGKGSPLLDISNKQSQLVDQNLNNKKVSLFQVELGMRYGNPSISSALKKLEKKGCEKIIVLPLYPQYASATTGSTFDAVTDEIKTWRRVPELRFIDHYHEEEGYISALANSVKNFQEKHAKPDLLIMSYHGIPRRYFDNGDNYPCHCCKTSFLLSQKLGIDSSKYMMTFQSRFGREEWIKEYTDETLKLLPKKGIKNVQIICPGFSADCLETIEEIEEENREYFMDSGGEKYQYIPALNDANDHINFICELIKKKTKDWVE